MTAGNLRLLKSETRPRFSTLLLALGLAVALLAANTARAAAEDDSDSIGAHWAAFRLNEADDVGDAATSESTDEPALSTPPAGVPTPIEAEEPAAATAEADEAVNLRPTPERQPEEISPGMPVDGPEAYGDDLEPIPTYREGPLPGQHHEPPAKNCSSGHWLNRGGWYSQVDFSYMNRSGPEDFFFADSTNGDQFSTDEGLGFEPGIRFTVGEYLCRDIKNRDHALEFTYFGMHDWFDKKGVFIPTVPPLTFQPTLFAHFDQSAVGFNNVRGLRYEYGSDFDSVELNLRLSRRLGRDRMELNRAGCWERKCAPGPLSSLIAGVRIVTIDETYNFIASNAAGTTTGAYFVQTGNDMLGFQSGFDCFWQNCRWKAGVRAKGGTYINFAEQASQVTVPSSAVVANRDEEASKDVAAFLGEVNLMGAYQLRPNIALRASLDLMWVNAVALAPEQINFAVRNPTDIVTGGSLFYQGGSFGLEMTW